MGLNKIEKFESYAKKLRSSETEINALYNDFLINVTSFFREPAFFDALTKTVFPALVKNRKLTDPIRVWIPGCATGEEAYSMGMCLAEFITKKGIGIPIQIFATDLDEHAVQKARLGVYSRLSVQNISAERLRKYFQKVDGQFQIIKSIRDMCIFSVHNLMKDPPFSRIDLISCQNVLIYIESNPQRKILQSFHYALKPTGYLLLGKSESIGNAVELFSPVEKDSKLYSKKNKSVLPKLNFGTRHAASFPVPINHPVDVRTEVDVEREFDKLLLSRYVPPSILVNKDLEIIRFRGATSQFFSPASGKASLNILKMVKEELIFDLRGLIQKARKSGAVTTKNDIQVSSTGPLVSIEIVPIKSSKDLYYLITFKEVFEQHTKSGGKSKESKKSLDSRIVKLESALKDAREQIRATSEDFDKSREELQSANEEILSSNEELQSINEELETSKEELQSSNEELTTINEELQTRLDELKQSKEYIEAIIETIRGPLLVATANLKIVNANKAFYDFFKLKPGETEGVFMYDLADGHWDIPSLHEQIRDMIPKRIDFRDFEIVHKFPRIGVRNMVVNAHRLISNDSNQNLVLISFEDITRFKRAQEELIQTQEQLQLALEGGSVGTWLWDLKTNEVKGSREEAMLYGLKDGPFLLNYAEWQKVVHPEDLDPLTAALKISIETKTALDSEFRIVWPDKSIHWILTKANTYYDGKGAPEKMIGVNIDITDRKNAIKALEESEKRFHTLSDNAPVMIWMTDHNNKCVFLNKTWLSFTGETIEEGLNDGWLNQIHPEDHDGFVKKYNQAFSKREEIKIDYRLKRHDGEYLWMMSHGIPRFAGNDIFIGYIGTSVDINERIDLERQKDDFMSIASHELKTPVTSIKAYAQILQEKFRKLNDEQSNNMLTRLDFQVDKLTGLINTLLDVAKIQSGQMEYDKEEFDVKSFLEEVKQEIQMACPKHSIEIKIIRNGKIKADRLRTAQVLNNLILNAAKYSPNTDKIFIYTNRDANDNLIFTVEDFGLGISQEMQDKIFGRFFRVSEASGNRVSGLGLGLYIASQIVQQQGGKIWLESEVGIGSKFSFSLPAHGDS
jgi:two-component system, chemotaxis family, CheB/CheR fusion protein